MDTPLQTFGPNENGRDFVIGDMHGTLSCFENLLKNLNFDPAVDRMFSVGDLVDRGHDSLGCLRLIREDWFHCVLANHEQMMYEAFNGGYMGQYWFQNGGNWGMETYNVSRALEAKKAGRYDDMPIISDDDMELIDLLIEVEKLPYLITLNHKNGKKFHIIHAELPPGNMITDADLSSPGKVIELATKQTSDGDVFLWGRYKFMSFYKADLSNRAKLIRTVKAQGSAEFFNENLSHIISGHTIMQGAVTIVGQTNIDTGAYHAYSPKGEKVPKWAGLTCIDLDNWKFYKATPDDFKEVEPFVISKEDLRG